MTRHPIRLIYTAIIAAMAVMFLSSAEGSYNACCTPPIVAIGAKPNVMIVMDYSGSMQFPAYIPSNFSRYYNDTNGSHVADCDIRDLQQGIQQYKSYDPLISYYGYFDPDTYYVYNKANQSNPYFEPSANQPVTKVKFTASSSKASTGIWFTAAGHNFQPGDVVAFFDLTSHVSMNAKNGKAFKVEEVSGDRFRVNFPWNGIPDQDTGSVIKRISGQVRTGLSGNALNFVTTSRIDAALKALVGGKAECANGACTLRAQGSKRYFRDTARLHAGFYLRPGTLENPDSFDSGDYFSKDIFLTIEPLATGKLDALDALSVGLKQDALPSRATEVWYFTLDEPRTVTIKLESSTFQPALYVFQGQRPGGAYITKSVDPTGLAGCVVTANLSAGTYCVEATSGTGAITQGDYTIWANADLQFDKSAYPSHDGFVSRIGAIDRARVRVSVPESARSGIVQDTFDKVRYGFMYFKGEQAQDYGKILVGCENTDLSRLVNAIQGAPTAVGTATTQGIYPYGASPAASALSEAYNYFSQSKSSINSDFVAKGTSRDPYYDKAGPVPCRKTYAMFVSDGQWDSSSDVITQVRTLRGSISGAEDLRPDLNGLQNAKVLSLYSFGDVAAGRRSMKWLGMFGGFNNDQTCGSGSWPYPMTDAINPATTPFSFKQCSSDSPDRCCSEWASKRKSAPSWDSESFGCELPDYYFRLNQEVALQSAMTEAAGGAVETVSSGGPVATVTQQSQDEDLIVRAAFESFDPSNASTYLWRGHLEVFWPLSKAETARLDPNLFPCAANDGSCYDFDLSPNAGKLCKDLANPGSGHCWDGAKILRDDLENGKSDRVIFTGYDSNGDGKIGANETIYVTPSNASLLRPLLRLPSGQDTDAAATDLINWTRGQEIASYRNRGGWVLGDIVYSAPVVVGIPSLGTVSPQDPNVKEFWDYRNDIASDDCLNAGTCKPYHRRKKMVYVGGNDGMLHAFVMSVWDPVEQVWLTRPDQSAEIGQELWAYIPSNFLSELKEIANPSYGAGGCAHRSMVDLSPRAWDVYIQDPTNPSRRAWRTVLIGGERGGGDTYFALDVTDPDSPILLWEYSVLNDRVVVDRGKAYMPFKASVTDLKTLPLSWSTPYVGRLNLPTNAKIYVGDPDEGSPKGNFSTDDPRRHVAFMGGTMRIYNPADINVDTPLRNALFYPYLMAVDIESGQNLFKYLWPYIVDSNAGLFPLEQSGSHTIPYALADPLCLDLTDSAGAVSPDGFTDHIFVGDLMGNMYGITLRPQDGQNLTVSIDIWKTKSVENTNAFRGSHQPITVMPAAALSSDPGFLRVIFGTGKYDDVMSPGMDDRADSSTMSLYNLKLAINSGRNLGPKHQVFDSGLSFQVETKCVGTSLNNGCTWVRNGGGEGDCCQGSADLSCPESSCWSCIYDFGEGTTTIDPQTNTPVSLAGERVIQKALIAGGMVFVATYVPAHDPDDPTGQCTGLGNSYLYAFDFECQKFPADFHPFKLDGHGPFNIDGPFNINGQRTNVDTLLSGSTGIGGTGGTSDGSTGARLDLGKGVASQPVLNSSGTKLTTNVGRRPARVGVNLPNPVLQLKGWKVR